MKYRTERHGLVFTALTNDGSHPAADEPATQLHVTRRSDGRRLECWEIQAGELPKDAVERYLRAKLGADTPEPAHCYACRTELEEVFPQGHGTSQHDNSLVVSFSGGYGMFIDPFGDDEPSAVICHDCAHALCEQIAWVRDLLDPENSHSHRSADIPTLRARGHRGHDIR